MSGTWKMRRFDRLLTEDEAWTVASDCHDAVVAMCTLDGVPYAVTVNTVVVGRAVYFHCARNAGRKEACLRANPRVCVAFTACRDRDEPELSTNYVSTLLEGTATLVEDIDEKRRAALALCAWNSPSAGIPAAVEHFDTSGPAIDIWRIDADSISGKARKKHLYFK